MQEAVCQHLREVALSCSPGHLLYVQACSHGQLVQYAPSAQMSASAVLQQNLRMRVAFRSRADVIAYLCDVAHHHTGSMTGTSSRATFLTHTPLISAKPSDQPASPELLHHVLYAPAGRWHQQSKTHLPP